MFVPNIASLKFKSGSRPILKKKTTKKPWLFFWYSNFIGHPVFYLITLHRIQTMQTPWAQPFRQRPRMAGPISRSPAHTHHGLPGLPNVGTCLLQRPETAFPGASERNETIPSSPSHINVSGVHIFGMWEEAEVLRENTCWHGKNMSTPHRQWPPMGVNFFFLIDVIKWYHWKTCRIWPPTWEPSN